MSQIKSLLLFHGYQPPGSVPERWGRAYIAWLETLTLPFETLTCALHAQLAHYQHLGDQVKSLTKHLLLLARSPRYADRVGALTRIPGIGDLTAVSILIELQDISRFHRADQLASYLGLTPSQHSSGERLHHGHITRCGNAALRTRLVESSWTLIRYDQNARATFERIKQHTGSSKKAITAVVRRLALRVRRTLLDLNSAGPSLHPEQGVPASTPKNVRRYALRSA